MFGVGPKKAGKCRTFPPPGDSAQGAYPAADGGCIFFNQEGEFLSQSSVAAVHMLPEMASARADGQFH
jgi:hypothetical protein